MFQSINISLVVLLKDLLNMKWHYQNIGKFTYGASLLPSKLTFWSTTMCFICAQNIVFQHKIHFSDDVERMVCFPCVCLWFICVSFKFTLGSCVFTLSLCCYRAHGKLKMVSNQHIVNTKISWTQASTNLLGTFGGKGGSPCVALEPGCVSVSLANASSGVFIVNQWEWRFSREDTHRVH